jgi:hypothetical protein
MCVGVLTTRSRKCTLCVQIALKNAWNNWEWVMGKFVQALARDTFNVIVPKDLVYRHKVFNQTIG